MPAGKLSSEAMQSGSYLTLCIMSKNSQLNFGSIIFAVNDKEEEAELPCFPEEVESAESGWNNPCFSSVSTSREVFCTGEKEVQVWKRRKLQTHVLPPSP